MADRPMTPEEADALPLTQYLVMEVLAARHRTGEDHWTFPTRATPAVRALEAHGLVRWKSGIVERTILVWFTDEGRDLFVRPGYKPPLNRYEPQPGDDALARVSRSGLVAIANRLGVTVESLEGP